MKSAKAVSIYGAKHRTGVLNATTWFPAKDVYYFLVICLLLIPNQAVSQETTIHDIRHEFYQSTLDYKYASPLLVKLKEIKNPNALELAYTAATEAILAKPGWNIFKKMGHLRRSRDCFNDAVALDLTDVEIRFLRLSVEYHLPGYLGFSSHISQDKQMILNSMSNFENKSLKQDMIDFILRFCAESGVYNQSEVAYLEQVLLTTQ